MVKEEYHHLLWFGGHTQIKGREDWEKGLSLVLCLGVIPADGAQGTHIRNTGVSNQSRALLLVLSVQPTSFFSSERQVCFFLSDSVFLKVYKHLHGLGWICF